MTRTFVCTLIISILHVVNRGGHGEPGGQARFRPPAHGSVSRTGSLDLLAEGDAVERVEHGLAIPLVQPSEACWNGWRPVGSMFLTARESLHSWRPWVPRYSVPRSVRTRRGTAPFSAWKGKTRPHDRRLAIMEFGEAGLGMGVDEGLPIDPANPFQRAWNVSRAPQSPRHSVSNAPCTSFPAI
jgi:hypothetical protein